MQVFEEHAKGDWRLRGEDRAGEQSGVVRVPVMAPQESSRILHLARLCWLIPTVVNQEN